MSRSIAISLSPTASTEQLIGSMSESIQESFDRTLPDIKAVVSDNSHKSTMEICLTQVDKSLLERHNLRWDRLNNELLALDQESLEDYSEEEAEEAVASLEEVVKTSAILSGKALKSLTVNERDNKL